jgi:hypothetical protein
LPYSIAVILSEKLEKYKERFFGTYPMFLEKKIDEPYYFLIGDDLSTSLFMSVRSVYATVYKEYGIPKPGVYDRIIRFSLLKDESGLFFPRSRLEKHFVDDRSYIRAKYELLVLVEMYESKNLKLIETKEVKGSSIYRLRSAYDEWTHMPALTGVDMQKRKFEKAIEQTIQNVSEKVIGVLRSNIAEPKNGIEMKTEKEQAKLIFNIKFLSTSEREEHAFIILKSAPSFECLKFCILGNPNKYSLNELNKHLKEYYLKMGDNFNILIINKDTRDKELIKINWPSVFPDEAFMLRSLKIDISKQLKKIKVLV